MMVLGIESSCDETSASLVQDGKIVLSNVIYSQLIHQQYGGVVPELAARDHLNRVSQVAEEALTKAGIDHGRLDLIAVTNKPGLAGALLVGYSYAQGLAMSLGKPLVPVNHVAGHIYTAFLSRPDLDLPLVALAVSGGHTSLFYMDRDQKISLLGQTLDDAAGEAFDKSAKMMGLGYPGGPLIESQAAKNKIKPVKFPRALLGQDSLDFSFSGLKTSVLNYLQSRGAGALSEEETSSICAGFQEAVFEVLIEKLRRASLLTNCQTLTVGGGVAANGALRGKLQLFAEREKKTMILPGRELCTDNAAMIACCGYHLYRNSSDKQFEYKVSARAVWPRYQTS
ncbi:MAG: tRNA (adenosine(37)-N6)-threonylcarbamoyltransferase complex transferase subunit TsaD [Candidatus Edwardsbacteria bacterium]|nr:tRNA (adenosine(37)-N6)-threonylcarbamoyltransferase complex transferase subunit TsaD [Candidatus Edwardsbacteria bacterium]MBU1577567.1 tRNA (adenosine(37)-N6)-threonylcarbamoyltransferase complex transferase subunit TsaD [Candidatus Edwardsbacteria bacterium]MBU2462597.1 tRNA (adenosine(37)-N6)-threonylcarbamoyltransferase complex transferase subunit TsaD [Candidatus Edwardsbacteria bacterium]MBU2593662.1 tRNA (adenosine(37)-N6)-threonylcarbamoyltransferase complex transferase subunit TsaD 